MKKKIPLVSIIIAYYKKKYFFENTVNSILNQTYRNFEVIVIYDDTDKSELSFVKKIISKFPRSKVIINKKNIGAGLSRNKGIHSAKGQYVAFCDADDLWDKKKLEVQISFMMKKKINFCHTSYKIINYSGKILGYFKVVKQLNYHDLLKSCDIATSSVVINKNLLRKGIFFSNFTTKEDYSLWLKIAKKENELYGINNDLLFWRSLNNSLSDSFFQKLYDAYKVYRFSEKYNTITSIYFVIRLSLFALIKKIDMYR
jgi:teichuronic acid biosynthesis glycosyltransferase TuaG